MLGPGFLDPITLECVVNPGISPFGHVMGMATWCAPTPLAPSWRFRGFREHTTSPIRAAKTQPLVSRLSLLLN